MVMTPLMEKFANNAGGLYVRHDAERLINASNAFWAENNPETFTERMLAYESFYADMKTLLSQRRVSELDFYQLKEELRQNV